MIRYSVQTTNIRSDQMFKQSLTIICSLSLSSEEFNKIISRASVEERVTGKEQWLVASRPDARNRTRLGGRAICRASTGTGQKSTLKRPLGRAAKVALGSRKAPTVPKSANPNGLTRFGRTTGLILKF